MSENTTIGFILISVDVTHSYSLGGLQIWGVLNECVGWAWGYIVELGEEEEFQSVV